MHHRDRALKTPGLQHCSCHSRNPRFSESSRNLTSALDTQCRMGKLVAAQGHGADMGQSPAQSPSPQPLFLPPIFYPITQLACFSIQILLPARRLSVTGNQQPAASAIALVSNSSSLSSENSVSSKFGLELGRIRKEHLQSQAVFLP